MDFFILILIDFTHVLRTAKYPNTQRIHVPILQDCYSVQGFLLPWRYNYQ